MKRLSENSPASSRFSFLRKLRCEPLEDRRMLSVLFVDADAAAGGDGLAWSSAYQDLQDALSEAATVNADGDAGNDVEEIWIAEGTYLPSADLEPGNQRSASFSLVDGVTLYGGFAGTETAVEERNVAAHVTTLSGDVGAVDDPADNAYTVVYCGEGVEASLDGLSVTGGHADGIYTSNYPERCRGGGIYCVGTLTLTNGSLSGNSTSSYGGGIYSSGELTLTNSTVAANSAGSRGGGVFNSGTLTVMSSALSDNTSNIYGAGIYNTGTLTVVGSTLSRNAADNFRGAGGGIYNDSRGSLSVANSTLVDNSANYDGGAIYSVGTLTVADSTFARNSADDGGGIYTYGGTVTNTTFTENHAVSRGGAVFSSGTLLTVTNSAIRRNSAGSGGGLYDYRGTVTATNCTLLDNSADSGGGIYTTGDGESNTLTLDNSIVAKNTGSSGPDVFQSDMILAGSHNLIGNGSGQTAFVDGTDGNLVGTAENPVDPLLAADGRPLPESAVVDAGNNGLVPPELTTDLAGFQRIQDGDGDQTATVDMGAYELIEGRYLSISDSSLVEGDSGTADMVFTVTLSEIADHDVTFDYATQDGTAEAGSDYTATSGSGVIPAGETTATIRVPIHGDGDTETDETFFLVLSSDANVWRSSGVGRILNDDPLVVTTLADVVDPADGLLSLREALNEVDAIVAFDPSLYAEGPAVIALSGSPLTPDNDISIEGPGAELLSIDAGGASGVFSIAEGVTVNISGLTITGGSATEGGGVRNEGALTVVGCVLLENAATDDGGGIWNSGTLTVVDSTLRGNGASNGAGIFNCGPLSVTNSTLSGNSANLRGGGLFSESTLAVTSSALAGNSARYGGGGIFSSNSLTLRNSIIARNAGMSFPDVFQYGYDTPDIRHTLIGDGKGSGLMPNDTAGNLAGDSENPLEPMFVRVPSDGGDGWGDSPYTSDVDESANNDYGDLRLFAHSPAVDAGDNGSLPADQFDLDDDGDTSEPVPFDLAGDARVQDGDNDQTATVNMGAYETPVEIQSVDMDVLYVNAAVSSSGDGSSWAGAFDNLQDALGLAMSLNTDDDWDNDVGQIWIAEGTYTPSVQLTPGEWRSSSFRLVNRATLYGGFVGTETTLAQRDWRTYETVLSGELGETGDATDNAYTVVYCGKDVVAGLDGVTITGGNGPSDSYFPPEKGGGGGIYNAGTMTVTNSTLRGNAARYGGAICTHSGSLTITKSTVMGNTANYGGAICNRDGMLTVTNLALAGNVASRDGGGVYSEGGALTVANSTLAGNSAVLGGGIYAYSDFTLVNSIVALNGEDDVIGTASEESANNLIGCDPKFVRNPGTNGPDDYGDLRLTSESAAIDAGDTQRLPADVLDSDGDGDTGGRLPVDLDGEPRIFGVSVDIGAYEHQTPAAPGRETASTTVTTALDTFDPYDGQTSLREAIFHASRSSVTSLVTFSSELSGSTVLLSRTCLTLCRSMTIDASALVGGIAIDADAGSRVFVIGVDRSVSVDLIGLNVTNGRAAVGGGIYTSGETTISNCTLSGNMATGTEYDNEGGGVYNDGWLTITDSAIRGNSASASPYSDGSGGGVFNTAQGILRVTNCLIEDNLASGRGILDNGGGICSAGSLAVTRSTFSNNSADSGGGIYNDDDGSATITNSTFSRCSAQRSGGAIGNGFGSTLRVTGSVLTGNSADFGGGIAGGGVASQTTLIVKNSTLAANSAASGGGIRAWKTFTLVNSIVALNGTEDITGTTSKSSSNNLIGVDPKFARNPGTNGADDDGDLRLTSESAAIDAGDSDLLPGDPYDVDADGDTGELLPLDCGGESRVFGDSVDVGAYEYQASPAAGREIASTTVTTATDVFDPYDGEISLREAICYAGHDSLAPLVTFSPRLSGSSILLNGTPLSIDQGVTIDASSLSGGLTVDGGGRCRVFTVLAHGVEPVELIGLTVANGQSTTGGGLSTLSGKVILTYCTFVGNSGDERGGAIEGYDATIIVTNSMFLGNASDGYGGAIYSRSGTLIVTNAKFVGNRAGENGGGLYNFNGTLSVTNSTLTANSTDQYGGGIYSSGDNSISTLNNTIVSANRASSGRDLYFSSGTHAGSHNLISVGLGQSTFVDGTDGNLVGLAGLPIDPLFIRPPSDGGDGWGDDPNTSDIDESANDDYGNLRFRRLSPATDAGDDALIPADTRDLDGDGDTTEPIPFDLGGIARVVGRAVDIGAHEGIPGDLNIDYLVNSDDLDIIRANWGRTVSPGSLLDGDPSGDGKVTTADLDIVRANWSRAMPVAAGVVDVTEGNGGENAARPTVVYGPREAVDVAFRDWARARLAWVEAVEGLAREREERVSGRDVKTARRAEVVDLAVAGWEGE